MSHKLKIPPVILREPPPRFEFRIHAYRDMSGFAWQVVTINGVSCYLACQLTPDGVMHIPMQTQIASSQQEADEIKEALKKQALTPQIITPGSPEWNALAATPIKVEKH